MVRIAFPQGFLWGSATSAYQVEGGELDNDWAEWERTPGHIRDGSRCGDASGWWEGKAEEDLSLAAAYGQNAHRLGLEWSRLEREPGRWDGEAFARYRTFLGHARAQGLRTMVTLYHFTLPRWAARTGGWRNPEMPLRLAAFGDRCARELGDLVDHWVTINEPGVLAMIAYGGTHWPPGLGSSSAAFVALSNLLRGHALTYRAIRGSHPDADVGLVLNMPVFEPDRRGMLLERWSAAGQDYCFNQVVLDALANGRLRFPLTWTGERVDALAGSFDFLGLNYYGRYRIRLDPRAPELLFGRHVQEKSIHTEWTDWGEPHPPGIARQVERLAALGKPVYVTENGIYDNEDALRPRFLVEHLEALHGAIARGADVRGYFHWSLVDNFEWAEGYSTHFGLFAVDRATQTRTPRRSAEIYARICRANGIPADL